MLHIVLFHKLIVKIGVENIETFGCRVDKGSYYMLNIDSDDLKFLNSLTVKTLLIYLG